MFHFQHFIYLDELLHAWEPTDQIKILILIREVFKNSKLNRPDQKSLTLHWIGSNSTYFGHGGGGRFIFRNPDPRFHFISDGITLECAATVLLASICDGLPMTTFSILNLLGSQAICIWKFLHVWWFLFFEVFPKQLQLQMEFKIVFLIQI